MPDLRFEVTGAETPPYAAIPTIVFKLHVTNAQEDERIATATLRCQIRIAATQRRYSPETKARLVEMFGAPERWRETVRAFVWTHTSVVIPAFSASTAVDLPIPCTYDFEVANTKYFDALDSGEIPLTFLFSGTVFYENETGTLQVSQISWEREADYRLPVALWREMMDRYYPNAAWLRLRKDVFDRLREYQAARGLPTWEETLSRLLDASDAEVRP
ncbi:MAG: DUF6084 family protein [Ktedonobacterales bacterium]